MAGRNNNDAYSRLDFGGPIHHDDSDDDERGPLAPQHQQPQRPIAAPAMDPRYRTPSPAHPLAGYQLDEPPYRPQRQNTGGYPAGSAQMPDDTLTYQPSVSFYLPNLFICFFIRSTLLPSSSPLYISSLPPRLLSYRGDGLRYERQNSAHLRDP